MIRDLIKSNRTFRRFYEGEKIEREILMGLVDLARLSASAGNMQPLKYILVCEPEQRAAVFACLGWAGYLTDWPGPPEGERPAGYIVVLGDREISKNFWCDHGIAAQSILLGAREQGLGGCMHGSIKQDELRKALGITDRYEIMLVISLGKPKEEVVLEEVGADGSIKYWRDEQGVHHVPKRKLEDLVVG
jgi:nitroreductase